MIDLKGNPFFLSDEDCVWVRDTLAGMDLRAKIGQLVFEIVWDKPGMDLDSLLQSIEPAGVMYRPDTGANIRASIELLQSKCRIPMLIAANLERGGSGGNGGLKDGTYYASPMQVAATDDEESARRLGLICAREGAAVGINWTFEPVVDLDLNFNNPITNVRTFGSDPERVSRMAVAYIRAVRENGMAVACKHFPGDGVDFRDQHLLASVNTMSVEEWDASYGRVYRRMIDAGTTAVMSAHIKQPAYSRLLAPGIDDRDIRTASLSYELNTLLLRRRLGFNGLIVSDATQMAGFMVDLPREKAVPTCIASGCDLFLFTVNHKEDVDYLFRGVESGLISAERLAEAVTRVLALKASLKLHEKQKTGSLVPPPSALSVLRCEEHLRWSRECADQSVTLVKDVEGLLPLDPSRSRNIALCVVTNEKTDTDGHTAESRLFKELLEKEGFAVKRFVPEEMPGGMRGTSSIREVREKIDLVLYYANMKVASNQTSVRIEWSDFLGEDSPKYARDIPTVFVSASNPYHLLDVPMVSTYINAYSSNEFVVEALVAKLRGKSPFVGKSPVDPLCGLWDTRL